METARRCSKCHQELPLAMFSRKRDGYAYYCKPCHKAYVKAHYAATSELYKERAAAWRATNRKQYIENNKRYYRENKERHLVKAREWAALNPEKRKAIYTKYRTEKIDRARANEAAYRARNREACNSRIREWKERNLALLSEYPMRRRAAMLNAVPAWADFAAMQEVYRRAAELRQTTGVEWHVDHAVPIISKLVCGLHCEANLQVLPGNENLRKNNRHWPDMP